MNYKSINAHLLLIKKMLKIKCKSYCYYKKIEKKFKNNNGEENIFLIGTPLHGNLGDQAIALAEISFFNTFFPDINVYEIPEPFFINCYLRFKRMIKDSMIMIHGGGNIGTLWFHHEKLYRKIVEEYPRNKIIFFPQTIYFKDDEWGRKEFEISKKIFNANSNLSICAREKTSYNIMRDAFTNNEVFLIPDIVTFLKEDKQIYKRDGILLCLRNDKESVLSKKEKNRIYKYANKFSSTLNITGTTISEDIEINDRKKHIKKKFNEFRKSKLVITDRLHGMLFSVITGTPCIALSNCNHKVKGVYEWISNNEYIKYIISIDKIPFYIEKLITLNNCKYDNSRLIPYFNQLKELIIRGFSNE